MPLTREQLLSWGYPPEWLEAAEREADRRARRADPATAIPGEPQLLGAMAQPGRWVASFGEWRPASKNLKSKGVWYWSRARKRDDEVISRWRAAALAPPTATGKRRLWLTVKRRRAGGRLPDGSNLLESLQDSLVNAGLIRDDSSRWLEITDPVVEVDRDMEWSWHTTIVLEDV